jgi:hypothetical protein
MQKAGAFEVLSKEQLVQVLYAAIPAFLKAGGLAVRSKERLDVIRRYSVLTSKRDNTMALLIKKLAFESPFNPPWRAQGIRKPDIFFGYWLLSCLSGHHS